MGFTFSSFVTFFNSQRGKGGIKFFLKENFTLERGRVVWVYLFTIYLSLNIIIFFCHIFKLMKGGEGGMGFFFSPFLLFFVLCVKLLLLFFTLVGGKGCELVFHF